MIKTASALLTASLLVSELVDIFSKMKVLM
jgi:hypothetical protein